MLLDTGRSSRVGYTQLHHKTEQKKNSTRVFQTKNEIEKIKNNQRAKPLESAREHS